jgi:acetylornithine deacetylase/succinyl-diaminopimelate desuccinylase-like protein
MAHSPDTTTRPGATDGSLATQLCRELVKIPSVNPEDNPGTSEVGEKRCAQWLCDWIGDQFPGAKLELQEVLPDRPNVVARFPSDRPNKPRLLLAPHTDTVSVVGMSIDPFGGEIREGRVWGRGASDTKGPMSAMLAGLYAARDLLPQLSHEIWFAGLAGEEAGQHGAHALAAKEQFDLVIAGEPTNLDFVHTHKGSMFLTLSTTGLAVHAANPRLGKNAIHPMLDVLAHIRDHIEPWLQGFTHQILGSSTISVGTIIGGSKTNVVPDFCKATIDVRTIPSQTAEFEVELFARLRAIHPELDIKVAKADPLYTDPSHPILQKLKTLGSKPVGAPWFCDAAAFARRGSAAIALGPGSIAQAHTKDEWISTDDLAEGAEFFYKLLASLVV